MSAHKQCTPATPADCMTGTSCVKHGILNLCMPTDLSKCTKVDPLFVTPVNNVFTMFCDQESLSKAPANSNSLPCANYETDHGSLCLLKGCSPAQLAANSQECWLEELPNGVPAQPDVPESQRLHHGCKANSDCKTPGTSCTKHGQLSMCIPDNRSTCTEVAPLYVTAVDNVFTMFCNQAAKLPAETNKPPCEAYESAHGPLCLLPACTESQKATGATSCWLETLPSSAPGSGVISEGSSGLSTGAKAGIGAGVAIAALVLGVWGLHAYRKSQRKARSNVHL